MFDITNVSKQFKSSLSSCGNSHFIAGVSKGNTTTVNNYYNINPSNCNIEDSTTAEKNEGLIQGALKKLRNLFIKDSTTTEKNEEEFQGDLEKPCNSNIEDSTTAEKNEGIIQGALKLPTIEEQRKIIFECIQEFLNIEDREELMNIYGSTTKMKLKKKKKNVKVKLDIKNQKLFICSSILKNEEVFQGALKQPMIADEGKIIFRFIWKFLNIKDREELMNLYGSTTKNIQNKQKKVFLNVMSDIEEQKVLICSSILKTLSIKDRADLMEEMNQNDLAIKEEQNSVKNEEILKLIWKYLSVDDKFKYTLVCKRFNNFIFKMDYFTFFINLKIRIDEKNNLILSRDYKRVTIQGYKFDYLKPNMINMLKQLSGSVINLELIYFQTNILTWCSLLNEFPLVESLTLICNDLSINLSIANSPKFLHLRTLKLGHESLTKSTGVILEFFHCVQNLQSLQLRFFNLNFYVLSSFLEKHKIKLNSLSLIQCNFIDIDLKIFDFLHQLRVLKLTYSNIIINQLLASKCILSLTDLEIFVSTKEKEMLNSFLQNYFNLKEINENQLIEYEATNCEKPIVTKTKCPNSDNIITTSYHVHYCELEDLEFEHSDQNKCKSIPLTNLGSNSIRKLMRYKYLSIKVT